MAKIALTAGIKKNEIECFAKWQQHKILCNTTVNRRWMMFDFSYNKTTYSIGYSSIYLCVETFRSVRTFGSNTETFFFLLYDQIPSDLRIDLFCNSLTPESNGCFFGFYQFILSRWKNRSKNRKIIHLV